MVGKRPGMTEGWCGWPRCVRHRALAPFLLTRPDFSQRPGIDSFRVAACAARCTIRPAPSPIVSDTIAIALALPFAVDFSRLDFLTRMAFRPSNSALRARFDVALVLLGPGASFIISGALDNRTVVPVDLGAFRVSLHLQAPSWACSSTWCVRFIDALVSDLPRTFLDVVNTAWCDCFAAWVVWLASSSPR